MTEILMTFKTENYISFKLNLSGPISLSLGAGDIILIIRQETQTDITESFCRGGYFRTQEGELDKHAYLCQVLRFFILLCYLLFKIISFEESSPPSRYIFLKVHRRLKITLTPPFPNFEVPYHFCILIRHFIQNKPTRGRKDLNHWHSYILILRGFEMTFLQI